MMLRFISSSRVPHHFGEFLGQESELISWWGFFSAVSWLLFRNSFSVQTANFPWPTLGPAIRLGFSFKKSSFPSSEQCLCYLFLHDFFQDTFHPLASVQATTKVLISLCWCYSRKFVLLTRHSEPRHQDEWLSAVIILEYVTDLGRKWWIHYLQQSKMPPFFIPATS